MNDLDLDAYLKKARAYYAYFNQGEMWKPDKRPFVRVADMDEVWRFNTTRWLERNAHTFATRYGVGEVSSLSEPLYQNVVDARGNAAFVGPMLSEFDVMSDRFQEDVAQWDEDRIADPVAWIRTTTLYRALAEGLPTEGAELEGLTARAKHWSTCPVRLSPEASCNCTPNPATQRLRTAKLPCDQSPEWTL